MLQLPLEFLKWRHGLLYRLLQRVRLLQTRLLLMLLVLRRRRQWRRRWLWCRLRRTMRWLVVLLSSALRGGSPRLRRWSARLGVSFVLLRLLWLMPHLARAVLGPPCSKMSAARRQRRAKPASTRG